MTKCKLIPRLQDKETTMVILCIRRKVQSRPLQSKKRKFSMEEPRGTEPPTLLLGRRVADYVRRGESL